MEIAFLPLQFESLAECFAEGEPTSGSGSNVTLIPMPADVVCQVYKHLLLAKRFMTPIVIDINPEQAFVLEACYTTGAVLLDVEDDVFKPTIALIRSAIA